ERLDAGKPRKGKIVLKAYHAGGHVIIEINDNGRGLNRDRIVDKIITNNIATVEQIENFSDTQIYNHIFAAGFSTAEKVTNVSGRGVGMDVVRSNIEKIGGSVEVKSTPGEGSIFTVKIPLTLAIVSALIIRSGGQRFAIPQVSITELVQASEESEHTVEYVNAHPVLRLRDQLLPLVTLSNVLEISDSAERGAFTKEPDEECKNDSIDEKESEETGAKEKQEEIKENVACGSTLENIAEDLRVVELLEKAVDAAGVTPVRDIIRGGTDGSRLSEMGIPTPNIFTGGHNYHSRYEWASVNTMIRTVDTIVNLIKFWGEEKAL
ncbi:MAG: ATP-binding protein, partial [Spirochaetales bacterium]|nr:ATP-binding protein [Spirochaetales bacterium]